jgi:hypothetical protein
MKTSFHIQLVVIRMSGPPAPDGQPMVPGANHILTPVAVMRGLLYVGRVHIINLLVKTLAKILRLRTTLAKILRLRTTLLGVQLQHFPLVKALRQLLTPLRVLQLHTIPHLRLVEQLPGLLIFTANY